MLISKTFIERRNTTIVIALILLIVGLICMFNLPVAQMPDIAPPVVTVRANYIGANSQTVEQTVTTPIENQINGTPGAMYIQSVSANDGSMSVTVTFNIGTNPDIDALDVQNRVNSALPSVPGDVTRTGVTTKKRSNDMLMVIALKSPNNTHDRIFLDNYLNIYVLPELARLPGVGDVQAFSNDYSMRIWLDPYKLHNYGLQPSDIRAAVQAQNVQVSAGSIGGQPAVPGQAMNATVTASIPVAVYAGLAPMTIAIVAFLWPASLLDHNLPLAALAIGTLLYSAILAKKLYSRALDTLSIQAEKDELIAELEQARVNSDMARLRAEEANLAKSRFLATMSHELRTPLNAILGFSEVMKAELFGAHKVASYKDYSSDIHSSGQHLLTLINEILDLSRVEAGRYELKAEPVALFNVIEESRHLMSLRAKKREIVIHESAEPNLPRIWADERAVRQVALNLLSNAIKFTPQGGSISIKIGWTALGGQYFSVKDTGPGIPEDEIPVAMSSFGRGTLAQKNAEEGSGLGLPIVKGLIELHGGTFTLKSKVREGTEVIVVFPPERVMNALPRLDPEAPPPQPEPRSHRRTRSAA